MVLCNFYKIPFYKIKCRLVPLRTLMLEVATGPRTSLEESTQSSMPPPEQAPTVAKDQLLSQAKKKSFVQTLTPHMSKPRIPFFPAPQYWDTRRLTLCSHLQFLLDHRAGLAGSPTRPPL